MITVEVQPNGYIHIDMPSADSRLLNAGVHTGGRAEQIAEGIARALSSTGYVERKWFRLKRGLSNTGWRATYLDTPMQEEYLKEQERDARRERIVALARNPHYNGKCGINTAHSDEDHDADGVDYAAGGGY